MRFNIGQKVLGVNFIYPGLSFFGVPVPFLHDGTKPTRIVFKSLEVKEHHKVAYADDPKQELKYDGFRLAGEAGEIWNNQFPSANYGQLSDHQDRMFHIDMANMSKKEIYATIDNEENVPTQYELLEQQLDRIHRGLNEVEKGTVLHNNLQWLWNEIETEAKKQFPNFKIEFETPYKDHPDITHVKVSF